MIMEMNAKNTRACMKEVIFMDTLKNINKKVKVEQFLRAICGIGFMGAGLYFMLDCFQHMGWTRCQKFLYDQYPAEYSVITKKIIEDLNKYNVKREP